MTIGRFQGNGTENKQKYFFEGIENQQGEEGGSYPSFRPARKPATALPPFQVSWDRRL
jgi:hypothetical protein